MYGQQIGGAAANSLAEPAPRTPEVQGALDRLHGNVEYLACRLQVLSNRVQPLLAQTPVGQTSNPVPSYSCTLAGGIGAQADRVNDFALAVDDLLSRLEI